MNIFTMLSSCRGSKKLTIGNVIKFSNYKSFVLHTELRVSTLLLFILASKLFLIIFIGLCGPVELFLVHSNVTHLVGLSVH